MEGANWYHATVVNQQTESTVPLHGDFEKFSIANNNIAIGPQSINSNSSSDTCQGCTALLFGPKHTFPDGNSCVAIYRIYSRNISRSSIFEDFDDFLTSKILSSNWLLAIARLSLYYSSSCVNLENFHLSQGKILLNLGPSKFPIIR